MLQLVERRARWLTGMERLTDTVCLVRGVCRGADGMTVTELYASIVHAAPPSTYVSTPLVAIAQLGTYGPIWQSAANKVRKPTSKQFFVRARFNLISIKRAVLPISDVAHGLAWSQKQ